MFRFLSRIMLFLFMLFIVPALLHLAVWSAQSRPGSWRQADWSSANMLPKVPARDEARIYVMAARTGGIKGAFATHSWLVLKKPGQTKYDRYEVVGWGNPVRKNAYDPDGRWYSNPPVIQQVVKGKDATSLIPKIERAIADYRWSKRGDYTLWPGPNSNTFVATVIRSTPDFNAATPSTAVGRDFPSSGRWFSQSSDGAYRVSASGYIGAAIGGNAGFELNFLGLVAGLNPLSGQIKVPAFGTYNLWSAT